MLSLPYEILTHLLCFADSPSLASLALVNSTFAVMVSQKIPARQNLLTSLIVAENDSDDRAILTRAIQKPSLQLGIPASAIYERTNTLLPLEAVPTLAKVYSLKNLFFLLSQAKDKQRKAIETIVDECQFRRCIRKIDPVTGRPSCFMKHPNGGTKIYSLPTMEEVIQLEQRLNISLPMDYVHFLLNHSHKLHHFLSFSREAKCEGVQVTELGDLDYVKTTRTIEMMKVYQPSVLLNQGHPRRFLCVYASRTTGYKVYLDVTDPLHRCFGCVYCTWDSEHHNPIPSWVDHSFTDFLSRLSAMTKETPVKSPSKVNARVLSEIQTNVSVFQQERQIKRFFSE